MLGLDGELGEADARELQVHVRGCPACATQLAAHRATSERLRALGVPRPAPERLRRRVRELLDTEDRAAAEARRSQQARWLPPIAAVAAAAALLVFAVSLGDRDQDGRSRGSSTPSVRLSSPWVDLATARVDLAASWEAEIDGVPASVQLWRVRDASGNEAVFEAHLIARGGPTSLAGRGLGSRLRLAGGRGGRVVFQRRGDGLRVVLTSPTLSSADLITLVTRDRLIERMGTPSRE